MKKRGEKKRVRRGFEGGTRHFLVMEGRSANGESEWEEGRTEATLSEDRHPLEVRRINNVVPDGHVHGGGGLFVGAEGDMEGNSRLHRSERAQKAEGSSSMKGAWKGKEVFEERAWVIEEKGLE